MNCAGLHEDQTPDAVWLICRGQASIQYQFTISSEMRSPYGESSPYALSAAITPSRSVADCCGTVSNALLRNLTLGTQIGLVCALVPLLVWWLKRRAARADDPAVQNEARHVQA